MRSTGNSQGKTFAFAQEKRITCDPNECIGFLLHSQIEEFKSYVSRYPYVINMKERDNGNVPLHVVSSKGDLGLMNFLIQNGAELHVQDIFGNTPLHYATDKAKRSAVELLINSGANANLQDFRGNAPLHLACVNNDIDTVKLLLKFNADPEITDLNDMKPGDRTNSPMIKILLDRRINAVRTGEADSAAQSVQWMSFGVGLGTKSVSFFSQKYLFLIVCFLFLRSGIRCRARQTSTDDDRTTIKITV
jgi:hypothetical protein